MDQAHQEALKKQNEEYAKQIEKLMAELKDEIA